MSRNRAVPIAIGLLAVVGIALSAWLSEDAYISLRTIDNVLDGYGLTWNVDERVQVYTHPLWLLLNAGVAAFSGRIELSVLALSAALSLLTLWLVYRALAVSHDTGLAAVLLLLFSKSYIDYTSSGLENPLTRLLLVLFAWTWFNQRTSDSSFLRLSLLAALCALSRPDALLFVLPCLAVALIRRPSYRALRQGIVGLLPLAAWALFALFYYGTPFPNTAYAKLGLGLPRWRIVAQGLVYLADSLVRDPVTLVTVGVATWAVLRHLRQPRHTSEEHTLSAALLAGAWLYLVYVVWIGGDFMSGRFLDGPFLLAVLVLARYPMPELKRIPIRTVILATSLLLVPRLVVPFVQAKIAPWDVADERRVYFPFTGALSALGDETWPDHTWRHRGERQVAEGQHVYVHYCVGMMGYFGGPELFLVDRFGLTDPLLSRLPTQRDEGLGLFGWRPGHNLRHVPPGYVEGLRQGRNGIEDQDLAAYYDVVRFVTRGDLWDIERLKTVIRWQIGDYDHYLESYLERLPPTDSPPPR